MYSISLFSLFFIYIITLINAESTGRSTIHWYAPFYSGGGYCSEAIDFALSAHENNNISFQIHQHGDSYNHDFVSTMLSSNTIDILAQMKNTPKQIDTSNQLHIHICHSEPGAWSVPNPKYHTTNSCPPMKTKHINSNSNSNSNNQFHYSIGRTMFETDSIPSGWVDRLNYMNEIWVPTNFTRDIFILQGVHMDKIVVVPEPVDTELYQPKDLEVRRYLQDASSTIREIQQLRRKYKSIFLFVGKWETRKGVKLLIESYLEAFSPQNDVLLLILSSGYHSTEAIPVKLHSLMVEIQAKNGGTGLKVGSIPADFAGFSLDRDVFPPIKIIQNIPQEEMPLLYSLVDAVVSCGSYSVCRYVTAGVVVSYTLYIYNYIHTIYIHTIYIPYR